MKSKWITETFLKRKWLFPHGKLNIMGLNMSKHQYFLITLTNIWVRQKVPELSDTDQTILVMTSPDFTYCLTLDFRQQVCTRKLHVNGWTLWDSYITDVHKTIKINLDQIWGRYNILTVLHVQNSYCFVYDTSFKEGKRSFWGEWDHQLNKMKFLVLVMIAIAIISLNTHWQFSKLRILKYWASESREVLYLLILTLWNELSLSRCITIAICLSCRSPIQQEWLESSTLCFSSVNIIYQSTTPHVVHVYLSCVDSALIFISWNFLGSLLEISPVLYQPFEYKNSWVIYLHSWCGKYMGLASKYLVPITDFIT